jgi:hypothetical protein
MPSVTMVLRSVATTTRWMVVVFGALLVGAGGAAAGNNMDVVRDLAGRVGPIVGSALARVSERMCKQVSVSLPYRGDSRDEQLYDYTGIAGSTSC